MSLLEELRQKHPRFFYRRYHWEVKDAKLELSWQFELENGPSFSPNQTLPIPTDFVLTDELNSLINELVFSIGMVEVLSYWKAAAPAEIVVETGSLSQDQVDWWHDLLINGLGEYFYLNQIDFTADKFVRFIVKNKKSNVGEETGAGSSEVKKILLPLGGGKDSALALALVNQAKQTDMVDQVLSSTVNALPATERTAKIGQTKLIAVERKVDRKLLDLNKKVYLNGHTPFSALLAFTNLLLATLWGFDAVVLANEQSANEGNIVWLGRQINHQYSKTFEFETKFRQYVEQYLSPLSAQPLPQYFSLLRPLHELQIAQLFGQHAQAYLPAIRSCNKNQKHDSWCGQCAKCLFSYLILLPFVGENELVKLFGKNMLADESLLELTRELLGEKETKPFDCVGTHDEVKIGLYLCRQWYLHQARPLPAVLAKLEPKLANPDLGRQAAALLSSFSDQHHLPPALASWLKSAINNQG